MKQLPTVSPPLPSMPTSPTLSPVAQPVVIGARNMNMPMLVIGRHRTQTPPPSREASLTTWRRMVQDVQNGTLPKLQTFTRDDRIELMRYKDVLRKGTRAPHKLIPEFAVDQYWAQNGIPQCVLDAIAGSPLAADPATDPASTEASSPENVGLSQFVPSPGPDTPPKPGTSVTSGAFAPACSVAGSPAASQPA